jgi:hypothetical protein
MNSTARSWVGLLVACAALPCVSSSPSRPAAQCGAPEHRQFDFWVGNWDVFERANGAQRVARAQVSLILDDCVLLEEYAGADGHRGKSFSLYDSATHSWRQTWVTNRGEVLDIRGGLDPGGAMVLSGFDRDPAGAPRQVRGRWELESGGGGVREIAERRVAGAPWTPWFDLEFRPHHWSQAAPPAAASPVRQPRLGRQPMLPYEDASCEVAPYEKVAGTAPAPPRCASAKRCASSASSIDRNLSRSAASLATSRSSRVTASASTLVK